MIERMMKTALMRKLVFRPCLPERFQREQWNTWSDWVFTSKRAILRHLCSLEIRPLFNTVYPRQPKICREQCCDRWGEQLWMRFACFFFFFSRFYGFNWLHALVFDTTKSLRVWLLFVCLLNNCLLGSDWRPTWYHTWSVSAYDCSYSTIVGVLLHFKVKLHLLHNCFLIFLSIKLGKIHWYTKSISPCGCFLTPFFSFCHLLTAINWSCMEYWIWAASQRDSSQAKFSLSF